MFWLIYWPYVLSPMFPYISLYRYNPHTITQSNILIPGSRCRSSCIPTQDSTPSPFCCSFALTGLCCWVGRALFHSCRTLYSIFIPWSSSPYYCLVRFLCGCVPCAMFPFFLSPLVTAIETWKGGVGGDCDFSLYVCNSLSWVPAPRCLLLFWS